MKEQRREIPLTDKLVASIKSYWLVEYRTENPNPDCYFFQTLGKYGPHYCRGITPPIVRRIIKKYRAMAGINTRITPHTGRHTFISRTARNKDLETARELAGHSTIISTQRYLHTSHKLKREAIESLNYGI